MNRMICLSLVIIGLAIISLLNCQKSNIKKDKTASKVMEQVNIIMSGNFDQETAKQNFQILIDSLNNDVMPSVSGKDKDEATEVIKYFEGIKNNAPDQLNNEDGLIEAGRMFMRMLELFALTEPNEFYTNLIVATSYVRLATSIGGYDGASKEAKSLSQEFNKKGVKAAKALIEKFPDNPISYYQLAHTTLYTGGDEQEVVRQLNKCLEVDKNNKDCKDFLKSVKDG